MFFAGDTKPLTSGPCFQAVFYVQRWFVLAAAEGCLHIRGVEDEQKEKMMNALTKQVRLVEKSYMNCWVLVPLDYYF